MANDNTQPAAAAPQPEPQPEPTSAEMRKEKAIAKLVASKRAKSRAHAEFLIKTDSV